MTRRPKNNQAVTAADGPPNTCIQPTAPAVAPKIVQILTNAFPIYHCRSRKGGG